MLAGVGPVPAVMFVVAATEGWMPQSDEHLAALRALNVEHVVVVVSKADLAEPADAIAQTRVRLPTAPIVLGTDLDACALNWRRWRTGYPRPTATPTCGCGWIVRSPSAVRARSSPGRSPQGRSASVTNSSTRAGASSSAGLQSLERERAEVGAVARIAINLRGVDAHHIDRGDTVRTPEAWLDTAEIDVALRAGRKAAPTSGAARRLRGGTGARATAGDDGGSTAVDASATAAGR